MVKTTFSEAINAARKELVGITEVRSSRRTECMKVADEAVTGDSVMAFWVMARTWVRKKEKRYAES